MTPEELRKQLIETGRKAMTPEEYRRKFMCNSIAADLRAAALQADDWGHELREAAWQGWMLDNTWAFHEVAGVIESVRSRKEFMP